MRILQLNIRLITTLSSVLCMPPSEIISVTGFVTSTWYRLMKQPQAITIQQLLAIANGLHIPARRFFYYKDEPCVLGLRDEYVCLPYSECYYDDVELHRFVTSETNSATWAQAAQATGITRDNLRHSLLAMSRTPVQRFLEVCHVFGIDPFTILIDPNPEYDVKARHTMTPSTAALRTDVEVLRRDIRQLSQTVAQLSEHYQHLQAQHEALLREFHAYTDGGTRMHMAAEDIPDPDD